jgi:glycosyltransferase involved in cell wall biosynthesis
MMTKLSVVIGASNARTSVAQCLSVLESQRNGQEVEIIVVDNSTDGTAEIVSKQFPSVTLVKSPELTFIPELWEKGIKQSTGEIVAITTAHCVPGKNWINAILHAHASNHAGIGGAIENDPSASLVDWAIYFCRYSHYMLPFQEIAVNDFAGDNASYKRWALDRCRDLRRTGFWEPFIHARLKQDGLELVMTPQIVVYHKRSFTLAGFLKNRFLHGKQFGGSRAESFSGTKRIIHILLSPLVPIILLLRITLRVIAKRKNLAKYFLAVPILILFLVSWSFGELSGYLWVAQKKKSA